MTMTPYRQVATKVDAVSGIAFLIGALLCAVAIFASFAYPLMLAVALLIFGALLASRPAMRWLMRRLARRSLDANQCPWCGSDRLESQGTGRLDCPECGSQFTAGGDRVIEEPPS